jgi:HD superfamily phosphodiesterase
MINIQKIKIFVHENTQDRDDSHGYNHMKKVYQNAMDICSHICKGSYEIPVETLNWITIVSLLHDVADHKYDHDGTLQTKVKDFLYTCDKDNSENLWKCIECISFLREKRKGSKYYVNILPHKFLVVRNIVSDADKLEALGITGLERCEEYERHISPEKTDKEIINRVITHYKENLSVLAKEHMRTIYGRKMAFKLDIEMKKCIRETLNNLI